MKQLFRTLVFVGALCTATVSQAQILNIEKNRLQKDTARVWLGTTSVTANYRRQQVEVFDLVWVANAAYLSRRHNYMFITHANFVRVAGDNVISDAYSHGRINFVHKKPVSYEVFAQYQYDRARGLLARALAGGGLRLKLADGKKATLVLGPGVMWEREDWRLPDGVEGPMGRDEVNNDFVKSTTYLSLRWEPREGFAVNGIAYYQARFDTFFRPRLSGDIAATYKLNEWLAFTSRLSGQYDDAPVVAIERVNILYSNGIQVRF
ncbi:MAG: DUF481 domain-containing protein [Catalinimonas sp.]